MFINSTPKNYENNFAVEFCSLSFIDNISMVSGNCFLDVHSSQAYHYKNIKKGSLLKRFIIYNGIQCQSKTVTILRTLFYDYHY